MLWPNLMWAVIAVDCQWVSGPCDGIWGPALLLSDAVIIPLLLLTVIGGLTCLRLSLRLFFGLLGSVRWLFLSREARTMAELKKRAQQASADYLRLYR